MSLVLSLIDVVYNWRVGSNFPSLLVWCVQLSSTPYTAQCHWRLYDVEKVISPCTHYHRNRSQWVRIQHLSSEKWLHNIVRGVGYGVCQRLLLQLCQPNASDSLPQDFAPSPNSLKEAPSGYNGVTLIMACRNRKRAEEARTNLLSWFDEQLIRLKRRPTFDEDYLNNFLVHCDVQIHELDLSSLASTLQFAATVRTK